MKRTADKIESHQSLDHVLEIGTTKAPEKKEQEEKTKQPQMQSTEAPAIAGDSSSTAGDILPLPHSSLPVLTPKKNLSTSDVLISRYFPDTDRRGFDITVSGNTLELNLRGYSAPTISNEDEKKLAQMLEECPTIATLSVKRLETSDDLSRLSSVTKSVRTVTDFRLEIDSSNLMEHVSDALSELNSNSKLTALTIADDCRTPYQKTLDLWAQFIAENKSLKKFTIINNDRNLDTRQFCAALIKNKSIQEISLQLYKTSAQDARYLCQALSKNAALKKIDFDHDYIDPITICKTLLRTPNVESLKVPIRELWGMHDSVERNENSTLDDTNYKLYWTLKYLNLNCALQEFEILGYEEDEGNFHPYWTEFHAGHQIINTIIERNKWYRNQAKNQESHEAMAMKVREFDQTIDEVFRVKNQAAYIPSDFGFLRKEQIVMGTLCSGLIDISDLIATMHETS